jgi:hypothetical protein
MALPIEKAWQSFCRATALHLAPRPTREKARAAFFAGATSLYADIATALQADGTAGRDLMNDVHNEVEDWLKERTNGSG